MRLLQRNPLREGGGDPVVGVIAELAYQRGVGVRPFVVRSRTIVENLETEVLLSSGKNRLGLE